MPTYRLDPLHLDRLVCDRCRQAVALVDPLDVAVSGEMTARQALEACPDAAEAISRHEFACLGVQGQGERQVAAEGAPPQALLGAALRLRWERGALGEGEAARLLAEYAPGLPRRAYAAAWGRVAILDGVAYDLAANWFAGKGRAAMPTAAELECLCPGFAPADYAEAVRNNILWARR
jgi:hypothetical protein